MFSNAELTNDLRSGARCVHDLSNEQIDLVTGYIPLDNHAVILKRVDRQISSYWDGTEEEMEGFYLKLTQILFMRCVNIADSRTIFLEALSKYPGRFPNHSEQIDLALEYYRYRVIGWIREEYGCQKPLTEAEFTEIAATADMPQWLREIYRAFASHNPVKEWFLEAIFRIYWSGQHTGTAVQRLQARRMTSFTNEQVAELVKRLHAQKMSSRTVEKYLREFVTRDGKSAKEEIFRRVRKGNNGNKGQGRPATPSQYVISGIVKEAVDARYLEACRANADESAKRDYILFLDDPNGWYKGIRRFMESHLTPELIEEARNEWRETRPEGNASEDASRHRTTQAPATTGRDEVTEPTGSIHRINHHHPSTLRSGA